MDFRLQCLVIPVSGEPYQPGATHDTAGVPLKAHSERLEPPALLVAYVTRTEADRWLRVGAPSDTHAIFCEDRGEDTLTSMIPIAGSSVLDLVGMNRSGGKSEVVIEPPENASVVSFGEEQADNACHAVVAMRSVVGERLPEGAVPDDEYNSRYTPAVILSQGGEVLAGAAALRGSLPLVMMVLLVSQPQVHLRNN